MNLRGLEGNSFPYFIVNLSNFIGWLLQIIICKAQFTKNQVEIYFSKLIILMDRAERKCISGLIKIDQPRAWQEQVREGLMDVLIYLGIDWRLGWSISELFSWLQQTSQFTWWNAGASKFTSCCSVNHLMIELWLRCFCGGSQLMAPSWS